MGVSLRETLRKVLAAAKRIAKTLDFIGGPGGTRTPNQTVMSGGTVIKRGENR